MTEEISKAFRAWLASLDRGRTIDFEQAFTAGYRAAAYDIAREVGILRKLVADPSAETSTSAASASQAWLAGFENGQREMHSLVRDLVYNRVQTYGQCQDRRDGLAENSLNEHEKFKHTREAMEWLAKEIERIAPKKTLNFETGIAPAEARGPDNAS
ncbi:MAG: hypothetical protein KUL88_04455 [Rhizobium sp.]|nr:hypothetical protein [Rhizobium sp.]